MAMSRSFGGILFTMRSPMRISPEVMFSSPAIIRSRVDLPHPDGPTKTTNSPSSIRTSTPWMTSMAPKAFLTSRIATEAMRFLPGCLLALTDTHSSAPVGFFAFRQFAPRRAAAQLGAAIEWDYACEFNSPLVAYFIEGSGGQNGQVARMGP